MGTCLHILKKNNSKRFLKSSSLFREFIRKQGRITIFFFFKVLLSFTLQTMKFKKNLKYRYIFEFPQCSGLLCFQNKIARTSKKNLCRSLPYIFKDAWLYLKIIFIPINIAVAPAFLIMGNISFKYESLGGAPFKSKCTIR